MSIAWVIPVKTGQTWVIPGYPWLSLNHMQGYPCISRLILSYTRQGYPGISHFRIPILGYPNTSFVDCVIPGYPGITASSGYPWISRDNSGYGSVSFFQMNTAYYITLYNSNIVISRSSSYKSRIVLYRVLYSVLLGRYIVRV